MMKTYSYILLDWDGNLAKTLDIWLDATKAVLRAHGISKTDTEVGASFGKMTEHFLEWGIVDPEAAYLEADKIAKRLLPEVELYPDALYVLEELRRAGKAIALITTSPHENIAHLLDKHGMKRYFDVIIAGDDVTHHKPHHEPLEMALVALGGNKEDAVMIGDSDKDVGAARNYGVDSILFFPEAHHKFYDYGKIKALKPTHIVEDFKDILRLV